jgi:hypothetical protein
MNYQVTKSKVQSNHYIIDFREKLLVRRDKTTATFFGKSMKKYVPGAPRKLFPPLINDLFDSVKGIEVVEVSMYRIEITHAPMYDWDTELWPIINGYLNVNLSPEGTCPEDFMKHDNQILLTDQSTTKKVSSKQ